MNEVTRSEFNDLKSEVKDLKKIYAEVNKLAISTNTLATEMKYIRETQENTIHRLAELETKPAKRYDTLITTIITSIASILIGALAVILGIKK